MKQLWLVALLAGCSSPTSVPKPPDCGGVCGGTGPVTILANNPTSGTLHIIWIWQGARADSAIVAPDTVGVCVRFVAQTWAMIQGIVYAGPDTIFTPHGDAFDPVAQPAWQMDVSPTYLVTTSPAVASCSLAASQQEASRHEADRDR